jgi:hypothetical protein
LLGLYAKHLPRPHLIGRLNHSSYKTSQILNVQPVGHIIKGFLLAPAHLNFLQNCFKFTDRVPGILSTTLASAASKFSRPHADCQQIHHLGQSFQYLLLPSRILNSVPGSDKEVRPQPLKA